MTKKAKKLQCEAAEKQKQQKIAEVKYKNYFVPRTTKRMPQASNGTTNLMILELM